MIITFDLVKQLLKDAISDEDFVRKNTVLQDGVTKEELLARVAALKPDYPVFQTFAEVPTSGGTSGQATVDALNREIDFASGAPPVGQETYALFNLMSALPPLRLSGWLFSSDSTLLTSEAEVHYRFGTSDSWKKLGQIDSVDVTGALQLRVFVPTPLGGGRVLKKLIVLAAQL